VPGDKMCDNNNTQSIADYLAQLLKDKKQLAAFPNVFLHLERLLDDGKRLLFEFLKIL
jgi:protein quaking